MLFRSGTNNLNSDFDALVIAADHELFHDTSIVDGVPLDIFVYPLAYFDGEYECEEFVQIHDGRIIADSNGIGKRLQAKIQAYLRDRSWPSACGITAGPLPRPAAARAGSPICADKIKTSGYAGGFDLWRTGVLIQAAAVFVGGHADDVPEGPGEFAGVVIAELSGDIQHRPVRGPQQLRRAVHLLQTQPGGGTAAVDTPEAGLDLGGGGPEMPGQLLHRHLAFGVGQQIVRRLSGQGHLPPGKARRSRLGLGGHL